MAETPQQEVVSPLGEGLFVKEHQDGNRLTLVVGTRADADCALHWGLSRQPGGAWQRPPDKWWPAGTTPVDGSAVRTPFAVNERGEREVLIQLELPCPWKQLPFVVYFPRENRWVKHGGADFAVPLPNGGPGMPSPEQALASRAADAPRHVFALDGAGQLAVATRASDRGMQVWMVSDAGAPLVLHWGLAWRFRSEWQAPPEGLRPAGTSVEGQAARTPFADRDGLQYLEFKLPRPKEGAPPRGLRFVLFQPDGGHWLKSGGQDLYLPLFEPERDPRLSAPKLRDLAEQIVGAEMGAGSWTLMHRFNLCHDLLGAAEGDEDALALLFAWLRYSAIRQLDWQRNYNTKPRELSHAQDRLTMRLAGLWRRGGPGRLWARLMLTTLGRGGDGQRVRDEILQIMHRNHIKEQGGHFIEEWHQKLHNNTTPDDVVICEAYLAFLRCNGDVPTFYRTLEQGGVTRERLRGFERPIRTDPEFYGDRKDALVGEFENFLRILKSVHAGADLDSASGPARGRLGGLNGKLDAVFALRQKGAAGELANAVTSLREALAGALTAAGDEGAVRDLLFLDLALEGALRSAIERQELSRLGRDELANLVGHALRNLVLSVGEKEPELCAGHWAMLLVRPRDGADWALHARSVADRAARWVQGFTADVYRRLQVKAEFLGEAFKAQAWTVPLFSEEVIRGGPAFAPSLLLRRMGPLLRQQAGLGGWQVVSPAAASGRLRVVARLIDVQGERFAEPTVLVADHVGGDEEVPEGATGVVTSDTPDLVSHLAVRARNAGVLLATCFEPQTYERLKALQGKAVALRVTPGGDVELGEGAAEAPAPAARAARGRVASVSAPRVSRWALTQDEFTPKLVGGKSNNLNGLRRRLPDWVGLPASMALPFGVFEKVLGDGSNREVRREYEALLASAERNPAEVLARVREAVLKLTAPAGLREAALEAWGRARLPAVPWEQAWAAVRRVWASQWNDRAYLSRRARGVPHDGLLMAVLIQQVVEADYAFVIHTVNPVTGDRGEVFAEVVLGLGETLVGNYPGGALGFVCRKDDLKPRLLSYPGKGVGLYGRGVIFRSDSNGEDLEGFAGAGLYDSFLAEGPERRLLDYRGERLVWDAAFRDELLRSVARIGVEVERLLGAPQDIEGAVSGGRFYVVQTRPQVGLAP
jgi:alpha-glucan,water dikinase